MQELGGISLPFLPAGGTEALKQTKKPFGEIAAPKTSFDEVFAEELSKIKFSGHAQSRMISRELDLNENEMLRLENAVEKAEMKGANESLIMLEDKAFIVSIKNKTVITALDRSQMQDNVVTNIDSAVIA